MSFGAEDGATWIRYERTADGSIRVSTFCLDVNVAANGECSGRMVDPCDTRGVLIVRRNIWNKRAVGPRPILGSGIRLTDIGIPKLDASITSTQLNGHHSNVCRH